MITFSMLRHTFFGAALVVASTPIATAGTVDLNFEELAGPTAINIPYYYSFPLNLTQNGKVKITGVLAHNVDTDIRDFEKLAPSAPATALGNTPYNSVPGPGPKGEIRLVGGLLTKVEFLYGSSPGGDSAFGAGSGFEVTTKSKVGQQTNWSQFATNQGQPVGPHSLVQDYPDQSPYFNAIQFNTLRGGQAQLDNVRLTYESVPSILRNPSSITVTTDTYKIYATFHPQGALGVIDIRNFAEAMGVDHFNWVQRIVHYPDNWVTSPNRFVQFTNLLDRTLVDGSTSPTPGYAFTQVPEALYDPPAQAHDVLGLYVNNKWLVNTKLNYDNYIPYYNENTEATDTFSWQHSVIKSKAGVEQFGFYDAPGLGGHGSYKGQYLEFDTELVGVGADGSIVHTGHGFRWKSDAILATEEFPFAVDASHTSPVVSGGVFDVEVYAPSVPEPSTLRLAVSTSFLIGMYFLRVGRFRSKLGNALNHSVAQCWINCLANASRSWYTRTSVIKRALLALALILVIGAQPAQANHIGGWDLTRGGGSSILSIGTEYGLLRSLVRAYCPESTFTGTATLTTDYLDTIDILALGGQTADAPNPGFVSALSTSEQQAMFEFVERGGALVLILEHSGQGGPGGAEARQTFVAPFGMSITGSLNAATASITDPDHPIFAGANGTVTGPLFLGQSAYFDNLGPYAHSIANEVLTGQSVLAVIEPHAISPTSGPVVMLADSNALDLQNYSYALVTNALEYLGVTTCVPEPSGLSLAVMALVGAAGAVLMRRRLR